MIATPEQPGSGALWDALPVAPSPMEMSAFDISSSFVAPPPAQRWVHAHAGLVATITWLDINTWGVQPALLPLVARHTTRDGSLGSEVLQYLTLLGSLALVLGSIVPIVYKSRAVGRMVVVYTLAAAVVYSAAVGTFGVWDTPAGPYVLVALLVCARFIESYAMTMCYVIVVERDPRRARDVMFWGFGIFKQCVLVVCTLVTTLSILTHADCRKT